MITPRPSARAAGRGSRLLTEITDTATGQIHRPDPVLARGGGPAGNARLTAWTGLILLPILAVEGVTLLALGQLISWHIAVGVLAVPPALLKTGSTGWRIVRYYTGHRPYRSAGPPPLLLRALGPLVVISTLAVLGSGLALIPLGPRDTRATLVSLAGQQISPLTVHQVAFIIWFAATTLHVLVRTVPALRLVAPTAIRRRVPGRAARGAVIALALLAGAIGAVITLDAAGTWTAPTSFADQLIGLPHR